MTTTHEGSETSVIFSLRELADMEQERLEEEAEQQREAERKRQIAEKQQQIAEREAERARIEAETARRERVEREKAEARAREMAHERAAVEVARIETEARARLEAEKAARAHELDVIRVKAKSGSTRLRYALACVVGFVVVGGSAAAWRVNGHVSALHADNQRLRDDRWTVTQAHEDALSRELASLQARHDALRSESTTPLSERARHHAEAARSAIEAGGIDAPKLRVFAAALDQLAARVALARRVADADRRYADLSQWAHAQGKADVVLKAKTAAAAAHAEDADDTALSRYLAALDAVSPMLTKGKSTTARPPAAGSGVTPPPDNGPTTVCKNKHDPMCGFGEMLDN